MLLNAVIGGSTRLANALISKCLGRTEGLLLTARDPDEASALLRSYPHARIFPLWELSPLAIQSITELRIYCCALGVIHSGPIEFEDHLGATRRDVNGLIRLVSSFAGIRMHVVFVSSILAFRPELDRAYYSGWKNVLGGVIVDLIRGARDANVSIVFPGRLVEKRSAIHPATILYSSYTNLAEVMRRVSITRKDLQMVVGVDARLWLGLQSLVLLRKALLG